MCHEADIYNHAAIDGDFEGAQMDIYGNPLGSGFDLARDGAFEGFKILVLCAYLGEGLPEDLKAFTVPELSRKGFAVKICTTVDDFTKELRQHLYHVAWIISGNSFEGDQEAFLSEVKKFHEFGRGLMIWGDNSPYFVHANVVLRKLFGFQLEGNTPGGKELQPGDPLKPGFFGGHPKVCAGILKLHEGLGALHVKTCLADLQMDFQYLFVKICRNSSNFARNHTLLSKQGSSWMEGFWHIVQRKATSLGQRSILRASRCMLTAHLSTVISCYFMLQNHLCSVFAMEN